MRSLKDIARLALDVQNASNLSAVVHSFSDISADLRRYNGGVSINHHPISVLFATQIAFLTNVAIIASDACHYRECFEWALKQVESETPIPIPSSLLRP